MDNPRKGSGAASVHGFKSEAEVLAAAVAELMAEDAVVVSTAVVGNSKFYKLQISREFFAEALAGLYESIKTTEAALAADPAFQL